MTADIQLDIRPRTTGEILDDAWRLYLADAPLLLALSGLFLVPAASALLLLLALPKPQTPWLALLLPALTAALLPLTGLGSGACQEAFRRRAESKTATLLSCLGGALRRAPAHAAVCSLVLSMAAPGILWGVFTGHNMVTESVPLVWLLLLLGGQLWIGSVLALSGPAHPRLAEGNDNWFSALLQAAVESQRQAGKALTIALGHQILVLLAIANLYLLVRLGLWVAGDLAGFDVALFGVLLSWNNPPFVLALVLLAWLLLAPFAEASNYLLHVDTRARYEGLDLWYRVQRLFPLPDKVRAGAILLAVGLCLTLAGPAYGDDGRLPVVRSARREIGRITREVRDADPYPGGKPWIERLSTVAGELRQADGPSARNSSWLDKAIADFSRSGRTDALHILSDVDYRLALIEQGLALSDTNDGSGPRRLRPDEIRGLLPDGDDSEQARKQASEQANDKKPKEKVKEDDLQPRRRGGGQGPGVVAPGGGGGIGGMFWLVMLGLVTACVVVAVVMYLRQRGEAPRVRPPRHTGQTTPSLESILTQPREQTARALWQKADELASAGQFLEAVRHLYLAVLALLHRANLIRYERTRTNGEYVRQVRLAAEAPASLHTPFRQLTGLFDDKWYGERACDGQDYGACRALAEEIRNDVTV
jgi:hypothetical protein